MQQIVDTFKRRCDTRSFWKSSHPVARQKLFLDFFDYFVNCEVEDDIPIPRESKKIVQELQMSLTLIKSLNHIFVVVLMK